MDRDGEDAGPKRPTIPKLEIAKLKSQQARRRGKANRHGSASTGLGRDGKGTAVGSKGNKGRAGRHQKEVTSGVAEFNDVARDETYSRSTSREDTTVSEVDDLELDAEELRLQAEMLRLRERHFQLAKRTEEVRARKEAGKALEVFQVELRAELEEMTQSMEQEKREKLKEADVFKRVIQARIHELEGILNQLGNKVTGVNAMYAATAEEIKREFAEALARKKKLMDIEVQEKLAEFSRAWTSSGDDVFLGTVGR